MFCAHSFKTPCDSRAVDNSSFHSLIIVLRIGIMEKRDIRIFVKLTEAEKKQVLSYAKDKGVTLSSYVRKAILNPVFISSTDMKTVIEINKIGNNINQLVHQANKFSYDENIRESIQRVEVLMEEVREFIKKII